MSQLIGLPDRAGPIEFDTVALSPLSDFADEVERRQPPFHVHYLERGDTSHLQPPSLMLAHVGATT